jgi:hypothetical protein
MGKSFVAVVRGVSGEVALAATSLKVILLFLFLMRQYHFLASCVAK